MKIEIEPTNYLPDVKSDQKWIIKCDDPEHLTHHRTIADVLMMAGVIMRNHEGKQS